MTMWMITLATVWVAGVAFTMLMRTTTATGTGAGMAVDIRSPRRDVLRAYRRKRRPMRRPTMLSHLTDEQWQSHMEAFVDYQLGTGKYHSFTGLIPEWLESEGLPPSPLVPQYNSSGHLTGWVNTDVSTNEAA
jgi:hypothetical protein